MKVLLSSIFLCLALWLLPNQNANAQQEPPERFLEGERLMTSGDYPGAIQSFTESAAQNQSYARTYLERARCYIEINKIQQAFSDMQRYFSMEPDSRMAQAYNRMGYCYTRMRRFKEAIQMYSKSIELAPKYPNAYNDRAQCYLTLAMNKEAARDLESFKALGGFVDPLLLARIHSGIAVADSARFGRSPVAEQTSRSARLTSDGLQLISTDRGQKITDSQASAMTYAAIKIGENILVQTKLIEQHQNGAEPYLSRADSFIAARRYKEAIADFDRVIDDEKASKRAFTDAAVESASYGKAALLQTLGHYQEALVIFSQIRTKDPESEEAWFGEGFCYNKLGKYEDSLKSLNKAIELSEGLLPKAFEIRAQAHLSLGHREEAMKDLKTSTKLKETKPESH